MRDGRKRGKREERKSTNHVKEGSKEVKEAKIKK